MTRRTSAQLATALFWLCLSVVSGAQDAMTRAKWLYGSAAYEEALAALDKAPFPDGPDADIEPAEYRILCLFALKRTDQARMAIDTLLLSHPRYRPDPSFMSPGARAQFEAIRIDLIRRRYNEAKASFDAEEYRAALVRFDRVLEQLAGAGDPPALGDMRTLATGFRDLAKVNNVSPTPASDAPASQAIGTTGFPPMPPTMPMLSAAPAPAPKLTMSPLPPGMYDESSTNVVPPVPLEPILPPVPPQQIVAAPEVGLFEIVIDERGRVESAVVRRSISQQYDALVLSDARKWRYKPATRDGKPVKFRKVIEIYTASLASLKKE
jgi:tetratricopeptide (TPR) repeat protein